MSNPEFQFNFKFNLHKSVIPIGIQDDDFERLSVVYGVSLNELMTEVRQDNNFNENEASILRAQFPDMATHLSGKRIAFLGDSVTSDRTSFCNIIRTALSDAHDITILDGSISAYKVVDIITNLIPSVTDFHADIMHIMIGSNDMKRTSDEARIPYFSVGEYEKDLYYLIDLLTTMGTKLIISTIPPFDNKKIVQSFASVNISYDEMDRTAFNTVIRHAAQHPGCILNEMDPVYTMYSPSEITAADGLHLNGFGHRLLAQQVIEKMLFAADQ